MVPKVHNYYQFLQVDPAASPEVIEAAYRRLAKLYHPDYNASPEAMAQMQDLNCAYTVLKDPTKRHLYNQKLAAQKRVPVERPGLGLAIAPYQRTIVLTTAAAALFLFAIFSNPTATQNAPFQAPLLDATEQAAYIKQAVIATISANSKADSSKLRAAVANSAATPAPQQIANLPDTQLVKAQASVEEQINSAEQKTVGQLIDAVAIMTESTAPDKDENAESLTPPKPAVSLSAVAVAVSPTATQPPTATSLPTDVPTVQPTLPPTPLPTPTLSPTNIVPSIQAEPAEPTILISHQNRVQQTGGPVDGADILETQPQIVSESIAAESGNTQQTVDSETVAPETEVPNEQNPIRLAAELVAPQRNVEGGGVQVFEWYPSFVPAPDHGFELVFWRPSEDAMADSFGLTAPTAEHSVRVDLDDLDEILGNYFNNGEYRWGILYVQTAPTYRRIQLLSEERPFHFSNFGTNGKPSSSQKSTSSGE